MASSIEDWADQVLADYAVATAYPLIHDWQMEHGPLPAGQRLIPKIPFVAGGDYATSNLYALDAAHGMEVRCELAMQIRDLPDGTIVRYRVV